MTHVVVPARAARVSRRGLAHELHALTEAARVEALGRWLEHGSMPVLATEYRRGGDRVAFLLDGAGKLHLRLYWRRDADITDLVSIRFDERVGWIAVGRTAEHRHVVFYAWLATLQPA